MRPQKVDDQQLIRGLMKVIRTKGYDSARLQELAEATGLNKASLYHRFPNGKKQIAEALLNRMREGLKKNVFDVLTEQQTRPLKRLEKVLNYLDEFYDGGVETCLMRTMSMSLEMQLFGELVKKSMQIWLDGFTNLGLDLGFDRDTSYNKAIQSMSLIQGGLIISKGLSETTPFQMNLDNIKDLYRKI